MSNRWRRFWDSEILEVSFQVVFCKDLTMVTLLKMNMEEACGSFSSRMTAWQPYHMKRNSCWLQLSGNRTRTQPTNRIFCELTCSKQIYLEYFAVDLQVVQKKRSAHEKRIIQSNEVFVHFFFYKGAGWEGVVADFALDDWPGYMWIYLR